MKINPELLLFYCFVFLIVISTVFLIITKNIVHAAFSFMVVLLGVASIFIFAGAEFAAISQILVYAGGILVLVIFGIMLTANYTKPEKNDLFITFLCFVICTVVFGGFMYLINGINLKAINGNIIENTAVSQLSSPQKIGFYLLTDYALPFEVSGILLMVALIGAAMIAGKKHTNDTI